MAELTTIRRDNPLFIRYGSLVERCFANNAPVGAPLSLFPTVGRGSKEEGGRKHLDSYADPEEMAAAQRSVDKLRAALQAELAAVADGGHNGPSVVQQLQDFRFGLQRGKEVMLEENPFYGLAGLFYRINLTALKNAFVATQREASDNPPRPITVSRSYRHIWSSDSSIASLGQKLRETVGKMGSLGKLIVGLLLFAGSTLTTAKGVIDLVQLPGFIALFGDRLAGSASESARITFAIIVGFTLSSIILDYKSRLFLGAAESGRVFRGYYVAWRRHPRWVIIAAFLTMISIWTNYDGIVLLLSKTEDLAYQWQKIEQQVGSAMGDATRRDTENPASLRDLQATLHKQAAAAILQFKKVPEDEMSGAASSGVAKMGPRYWAKRFIVEGGYLPGQNDVAKVFKGSSLVGQIDGMLRRSGLDLQQGLEEKIGRILATYDSAFQQSERAVQQKMAVLSGRMTSREYSLEGLITLFKLESYHINEGVQGIVVHLEENKEAFAKAAREINQLAESHIALLREVDKTGVATNNDYTVDINMGIPKLEAIDQLKQGSIPMAKRHNLVELKEIMLERYGVFLGGIFLFFVLFLAVFMDLSDPILYSAMVARWGRRDRHFLDENVKRFQEWEENHVHHLHRFLVRSDVLALLPKLPTPKIYLFHHRYNHFLEAVEPRVKDPASRSWWERIRFWFSGLFQGSRIDHVEGYNARQTALTRCLRDPETFAPRILNTVFPGLLEPVQIGVDHFDSVFDKIYARMKQNEREFEQALARYAPESVAPDPVALEPMAVDGESLQRLGLFRGSFQNTALYDLWSLLRSWFRLLLWQPVDAPSPTFPLTRISQIRALALSHYQSRSHISQLAEFVPSLRHFVRQRLFVIKQDLLQPIGETLAKIPNGNMLIYSFRIHELQEEYAQLERGLLELLGLSQFQGIQISEQMVHTIVEQSGVDEIAGIYLRGDLQEEILEKRIGKLEFRLARAYKLIRDLVEGQDTLIFTLTRIRREYLSPIQHALAPLHTRGRIEEALGLHKMKEDLAVIESCLLELWDPTIPPIGVEPAVAGAGLGAIIDLIRRNSAVGQEFDLVLYVKQLEIRMAAIHKQLDTAIYQLSMVDKITTNALGLLDHAVTLVQQIFVKDEETQNFALLPSHEDQKKFDFLEENRLFFRTVFLQVDALRARFNTLDMRECLLGGHGMDLARDLEKQAIMLRYFLKNALDFLEDKRDSVGLSAALAELQPHTRPSVLRQAQRPLAVAETFASVAESLSDTPPPTVVPSAEAGSEPSESVVLAQVAAESGADGVAAGEQAVIPPTAPPTVATRAEVDAQVAVVQSCCMEAKEVLLEMSLWEWDLLKKPIPPPELLHTIQTRQPEVDRACLTVEGILVTLEGLTRWHDGALGEIPGGHVATLQALRSEAEEALEKLYTLFDQISLPPFVDRRSKVAVNRFLKEKAEQRRKEARSASTQRSERGSRRLTERVAVGSRMEVQAVEGDLTMVGVTRDVSAKGFCMEADGVPGGIISGMEVRFNILSDAERTPFFGRLFRTSGTLLVVLLEAGHEVQFMALIRAEILRGRQGSGMLQLNLDALTREEGLGAEVFDDLQPSGV
ncbi:MAG: hypothetical protein HQL90_07875 [Magnetococcales bacterium]|nr:hypothetical protein [Magnetococcales bacterium]